MLCHDEILSEEEDLIYIWDEGKRWNAKDVVAMATAEGRARNLPSFQSCVLYEERPYFPYVIFFPKVLHNRCPSLIELSFLDTISMITLWGFRLYTKGTLVPKIIAKVKERRWSTKDVVTTATIDRLARNYLASNIVHRINIIVLTFSNLIHYISFFQLS